MIAPETNTTVERPQKPEVRLRDAEGCEDAFYLDTLWHHYFGTDHYENKLPGELGQVAGWRDEDDQLEVYGTIAVHDPADRDGTVPIGGGVVSIKPAEEFVESLPVGDFDAEALAGERNAWLWFGVVDPNWRGRGIGRRLFEARLRWAERADADLVAASGWERRSGRTSRPLFEAFDFIPIQRFEDFYADNREACPDCGVWPSNDAQCQCAMTLWTKDLPGGK